ncbi:MAG TPA: hypothetical protein VHZ73_10990 [Vicinamibacterales bacterium]|nr:hypothetical protein [Vicinamibacterales bacterium]
MKEHSAMRLFSFVAVAGLGAIGVAILANGTGVAAQAPSCSLAGYKAAPGLTASAEPGGVALVWDGDGGEPVRLRLGLRDRQPLIREVAVSFRGTWRKLAQDAEPSYEIAAGFRRMSNQQIEPLNGLKVPITPEIIDKDKWDAFWDAPLNLEEPPSSRGNPPPGAGIANQPGLPRKPSEITRARATYDVRACSVRTDGARVEVSFPGATLGPFKGELRYTVYKGTNLIRQEIVATTDDPSVAYKYDAGISGIAIQPGGRVAWRDPQNIWHDDRLDTGVSPVPIALKTASRIVVAERGPHASLAVFPPPHTFFWARELATNLGYDWYQKTSSTRFALGVRQAEKEENAQYAGNFALYSARPGTEQHMPVYLYPAAGNAEAAADAALAFTHGDHYKPLAGYEVMNHHYHMDLGQRLITAGSPDAEIPDLVALKALGINIVSQIDSVGTGAGGRGDQQLAITQSSVDGARKHSSAGFLVMPDQEFYGSPLGGHTDLLFSHPVYWSNGRAAGVPLTEDNAKYSRVYHIGSAEDLMTMMTREEGMISMPHPRTKGSTGFPDAVKDEAFFKDPRYQGVGFRWGMGLDLSETRLCEYRCLPLLDDMSNWVADLPIPPKYILSISEARYQAPGDDIYASSPVSYVHLDSTPDSDHIGRVIDTLMKGDYFVTSGEVLIRSYAVEGTGTKRTVSADLEWTYPLEFVEVVWGDGKTTGRQVISATDLPPLGTHKFRIPFDATGKKWVRFAAWDSAGNGALTQPIKLP